MKTNKCVLIVVLLGLGLNAFACEAVNFDVPGVCNSDSDCSGGELCREGVCAPLCSDDSECDFYCDIVTGTCSKCLINFHCPEGFACDIGKGVCFSFCGSDSDCGNEQICQNGQCVAEQCTEDADCKDTEEKCLDRRCVAATATDYPEQIPCQAGRMQCWNNKSVRCSENGDTWLFNNICKEGDGCLNGLCSRTAGNATAYVCQPYVVKCAGETRMQICRPDGSQFVEWINCPDNSVCSNGDCTSLAESDGDTDSSESVE